SLFWRPKKIHRFRSFTQIQGRKQRQQANRKGNTNTPPTHPIKRGRYGTSKKLGTRSHRKSVRPGQSQSSLTQQNRQTTNQPGFGGGRFNGSQIAGSGLIQLSH